MSSLSNILPGGFDSTAVQPQTGRADPLPVGVYDVEITDSEVKETSKQNGTGLKMEYTVISPAAFTGRKIFGFLNLKHENSQAEQIGQAQLSSLCRAVGITVLKDSDDLFGKIVRVRVKIRPPKGDYEASNDITSWEAAGAALPIDSKPSASLSPKAAPWARKAA